ncbi:MAG TPA: DNA polymerase/3'-5' exonuclease PolX [Vicinamibacterales bacterium]|nr:DNA polymerase/3'-5' exonuclease PolX [Vicinamibacterales bacterium]
MTTHPRARKKAQRRAPADDAAEAIVHGDLNMAAAALLYDMAALQPNERSQFGYKRAARVVAGLPVSVADLVAAGTLRDVEFIGPSSARIITEVVELGRSPSVEAALAKSTRPSQVTSKREFRGAYLSHFAMQSALAAPLGNDVIARGDYRGDFQMHSTWSDGGETIATLAAACAELGHTCLGITDHSYGLPIARGISMTDAAAQHREIDQLNAELAGRFRVFKGIESNILADGNLDLQPDERSMFQFVVASPHSLLRRNDDQTVRMLAAVNAPGVAILGHPRGRVFNSRPGVKADWLRVFEAAARRRVAIELDGNWHRQDIDFELARHARDVGCIFALDSDAHSIGELRFSDYAIAHARLAGIPASRVINCWSDDELDEWMGEMRER